MKRSAEHFRMVFNHPCAISDAGIDRPSRFETNSDLDVLPSLLETIQGVQQPCSGKVPESDAISAEVYARGDPRLMIQFTKIPGDVV
ncbi:unnamed protein product [Dibothriocephalus latus]|uniref:Uncharacterized protein n=1 Tax=Dibothriocephalus latus TaxID=60516 RepID=A0A3P7NMH1_DIBLA|nr:unnamed protein product [Dibothriocephalus latus]